MPDKYLELTPAIYSYLTQQRSKADDTLLDELRHETSKLGKISAMQISEEQGSLFTLLVAALNVQNAIEIGTFTGYSAVCIARGLPKNGKLLCLDVSDEWTSIARKYWARAGLENKISLRIGPAEETLKKIDPQTIFDFVFIDADKPNYETYYELLLPKTKTNGLIIFDNMLWGGRLGKGTTDDPDGRAIDALNKKLSKDSRIEAVLIPVADGLMICRKK
jgi:caffeoyl-CoA O-methyltransferase